MLASGPQEVAYDNNNNLLLTFRLLVDYSFNLYSNKIICVSSNSGKKADLATSGGFACH